MDKTHHFARISRKGMLLGIIGFLIILYIFVASALSGGSLEKIIRRHQASKNSDPPVRSQDSARIWRMDNTVNCLSMENIII